MTSPTKSDQPLQQREKMLYSLTGMTLEERKVCKARSIKFPVLLMYVLECGDFDEIISWTSCGQSFEVHDPMAFERNILPQIFNKKSKFSSFQRKLLRWAFDRNKPSFIYTHPKFKRGEWNACKSMTMASNKKDRKLIKHSLKHSHHLSGGDDTNSTFSQNSREHYSPPSRETSCFGSKIQKSDSFSTLATQSTKDTSFYSGNSCHSASFSQRSNPEDEKASNDLSYTRMIQSPLRRQTKIKDEDVLEEQIEHMKVKLQHLRQAFSHTGSEHFGISPCLIGYSSSYQNPVLNADKIMREAYAVLEN